MYTATYSIANANRDQQQAHKSPVGGDVHAIAKGEEACLVDGFARRGQTAGIDLMSTNESPFGLTWVPGLKKIRQSGAGVRQTIMAVSG